jgi:hypothetical protein
MAEITIKFLKSEFCRFEPGFKDLKVRIKITDVWDIGEDNIFTAKITDIHGMEYPITDWTETIVESTTKLTKEYDLNLVGFTENDIQENSGKTGSYDNERFCIPLNIGKNTLTVQINDTIASAEFDLVPITVASIKNQYLLGVDLQSRTQLTIQQELREITGVEFTEISNDTTVGAKDLVWDATAKTLQWDNGKPIKIVDAEIEYLLPSYLMIAGLGGGDYVRIIVEDVDDLPSLNVTEELIVDVKQFGNSDFQYWINNGYQVALQTIAMVDLEPTLYTSDKLLVENNNYKYLDPIQLVTKRQTRTQNFSFETPINMLQKVIELWGHYSGENRVVIDNERIEIGTDGNIVIRGFPLGFGSRGGFSAIGFAGLIDRTINAETYPGSRNPTNNFWQMTGTFGVIDKGIRDLFISVAGKIASIDLLLIAGVSKGQGIASQSFSVDGVSSAYTTTESAENSLYSGVLTDLQRGLGVGKATKEERETGLVNKLRKKIEGGSLVFKF